MEKTRIGMIGAGTHATNMLFPSLNFLDDVEIERVAVCDLREDLARNVAMKFGFPKAYKNYKKMLTSEKVDGVIICINAKEHPHVVRGCLELGVDVLVEKPASTTPEESREIWEVAKKNGRLVMVEHQKRRATAYLKALEIIKKEEFGEVAMIKSKQLGYSYDTLFNCLIELQIHNIDIMRAFGGEVVKVKASQKKISHNRAAIAAILEFESGAVGTVHIGTEGGRGSHCESLDVIGTNGCGVIVENVRKVTYYRDNDAYIWQPDWMPHLRNTSHVLDGYVDNIKHFCECIRDRREPVPNIYDEMKALEIIYEICAQLDIPTQWFMVMGEK
jgi:predicted dehydrogenase